MIRMVLAIAVLMILSGCAANPSYLADRVAYCKPGSAIRYEGAVPKNARNVRPAPAKGTCSTQI